MIFRADSHGPASLRHHVGMYYQAASLPLPSQLDLLDEWLPELVVHEVQPESSAKQEAEYRETRFQIDAVRYKGSFYVGGSRRISQITGRLIGTAKGNQEKERKAASMIQSHLAALLVTDFDVITRLKENTLDKLSVLDDEALEEFYVGLYTYIEDLIQ